MARESTASYFPGRRKRMKRSKLGWAAPEEEERERGGIGLPAQFGFDLFFFSKNCNIVLFANTLEIQTCFEI
jgi:hypothetical protein